MEDLRMNLIPLMGCFFPPYFLKDLSALIESIAFFYSKHESHAYSKHIRLIPRQHSQDIDLRIEYKCIFILIPAIMLLISLKFIILT